VKEKLKESPADAESLELKEMITSYLDLQEEDINRLREKIKAAAAPAAAPAFETGHSPALDSAAPPKWSAENHPAFQNGARKTAQPAAPATEPAPPRQYSAGEKVLALWKRAYYQATIVTVMGGISNPKYYVKYDVASEYATLGPHELKPIENRKRKAESGSTMSPVTFSGSVISAAPDINPLLADQAKREPNLVSDGPARPAKVPKKIAHTKRLEKHKNAWQAWNASGKAGKKSSKDSMFRTPEGINARGMFVVHIDNLRY
jgi:survival-of-motor-neuron-related-splicing factor 30